MYLLCCRKYNLAADYGHSTARFQNFGRRYFHDVVGESGEVGEVLGFSGSGAIDLRGLETGGRRRRIMRPIADVLQVIRTNKAAGKGVGWSRGIGEGEAVDTPA